MHIDHSKLVELLVETSGIEKDKIETQLTELVDEIREAISEGEAYEVDGLGIFSGIGNNMIFMPSEDLATEINYKYVGMEAIKIDDAPEKPKPSKEKKVKEDDDDPFAGLLGDDEDEPQESDSSFELDEPDEEEPKLSEKKSTDIEDFADASAEESPFDLGDEDLEEEKPGPDKWGIDTYKDDSAESMFSGLLGDRKEDEPKLTEQEEDDLLGETEEEPSAKDHSEPREASKKYSFDDDNDTSLSSDKEDLSDDEDYEDPFKALLDNDDEEEDDYKDEDENEFIPETPPSKENKKEVVPVIKNLSSGNAKKPKEQKEKPKATFQKNNFKQEPKSQPVMLWVVLIILLLGGGTYGVGYFGIVHIPGVTPESSTSMASSTQPDPAPAEQQNEAPAEETPQAQPQQTEPEPETEQPASTTGSQEQEPQPQVSQSEEVPANQSTYGLTGVPVPSANDGYTIVIYSLTRETNIEAKRTELTNEGYRVLVSSIPSQRYGTLWRLSLGQFDTMRDAALAAETLEQPYSENYFITEIQ